MTPPISHLDGRTLLSFTFDGETHAGVFAFEGGVALRIDSPWRILSSGRIVVGNKDDGQQFGLPSPVDVRECVTTLIGSRPVTALITNDQGDLHVHFGDDATLQVFNASSGYEGWQLYGPGDRHVIGMGGGGVFDSESQA